MTVKKVRKTFSSILENCSDSEVRGIIAFCQKISGQAIDNYFNPVMGAYQFNNSKLGLKKTSKKVKHEK